MKHKIFGGIAVLAIAAVAALNVNLGTRSNGLSDISLANIDALAQYESGSGKEDSGCYGCLSPSGSVGAVFYCICGNNSCYSTSCVSGYCI